MTVDAMPVRAIRLNAQSRIEIRGATVLDGRGGATRATLRIEGERIASVASSAPAGRDDAEVIDASGRFVIAGLIDAHLHFATGARPRRDLDAFEQRDEGVALLRASLQYDHMLRAGITTVRALGGEPAEAAVAIRRAMLDQFLIGPRVLTAGTAVVMSRAGSAAKRLVEAIKVARRNFGHYAEVVMLGSCQQRARPPFTPKELADLVEEAHRRRVQIVLRPLSQAEAIAGARAGIDSIEGMPRDADKKLIGALVAAGTALVALAASERDAKRRAVIRLAHESGVPVVAGSDWSLAAPDRSLGRELAALQEIGLGAAEVMAAAGWRAAAALGLRGEVGEIAEGKLADLVVLRADPRADGRVLGDPAQVEAVIQASDPLTS